MKPILFSTFLLLSLVGWGQCQVVVTSDEGVVVELSDYWKNHSEYSTVKLKKGDFCEMGTSELSTEGRIVLVHIEFEDVNDKGKKKRGVIVNPIDGWYHKIEEECETDMLIPLR
jgi:hypothetical protein